MKLSDVKAALLTVTEEVHRYAAPQNAVTPYIVWGEDNQASSLWADGRMVHQSIEGTIDYYSKTENDANVPEIQNALNNAGISFRLNSVQYEAGTKITHHEWVF